jgi:hypothetical protein
VIGERPNSDLAEILHDWYMEDYLPIYRALIGADKNNKTCDTLSFEDKTSYEKIHTRYCKTILGLKKTSLNFV